jgi:hypothetical protein
MGNLETKVDGNSPPNKHPHDLEDISLDHYIVRSNLIKAAVLSNMGL